MFASLAAGASGTVTVTLTAANPLEAQTPSEIGHGFMVYSDLVSDPSTSNNRGGTTVSVQPPTADLAVVATALGEKVKEGQEPIFTVSLVNQGPDAAKDVVLAVRITGRHSSFTWVADGDGKCAEGGGVIECTYDSIAAGATSTIDITISIDGRPFGDAAVSAHVFSLLSSDPSLANNDASAASQITEGTPPTLTVPAPITVDATGPSGAVVMFSVTATDNFDPSPSVVCTPSSGSTFPIGQTTVVCTATDDYGNSASAQFTITVRGALEQLLTMADAVRALGPGSSLTALVTQAGDSLSAGNVRAACGKIEAFRGLLSAQQGKRVDAQSVDALLADSARVLAVLEC